MHEIAINTSIIRIPIGSWKRYKPINKPKIDELTPHIIDDNPIPKNIIAIMEERLHLSLNQPKGIAPKPINKAPRDHNLINSSYESFQSTSIDKTITK